MTTIIGIDPGSRYTGYGVIKLEGHRHIHIVSGRLDMTRHEPLQRLQQIYLGLNNIIQKYLPDEGAIEEVFMRENVRSALLLGQARGAALVALGNLCIEQYSAREVKKSVVGYGAAEKDQVQFMVKQLLCLSLCEPLSVDASDALAVALCHAQARGLKKLGLR